VLKVFLKSKAIFDKENRGVSVDRNIRMKHSQDKLIDFAYGDDSMDRQRMSLLVERSMSNNSDMAYCNYLQVDE